MSPAIPELLPIEYVMIIIYLVFLASVGPLMRKFNKNSDDYFRGGARTSWWLLGPSLALSITSASVFTGVAGAIFEGGLAPMASNLGQYAGGILLIWFLAAWFRQLRKITPAEVIRERFGPTTEQFFAYLSMFMQPVYGAFQLLGLSIFVAAIFQIPLEWSVLSLGTVVGVYSVAGGKWAVMATDFLQSLILQPVVYAVGILAVIRIGGIGELFSRVGDVGGFTFVHEPGAYPDGQYTLAWIIAVFSMQFVAQLQLGWSARFFMAKDGNEARKAAALMFAILMGGTVFFMAVPLVARVLFADQVMSYAGILNKPEEAVFVVACLNLLPNGMIGLVLVAMFSATASSMDTGLNSNAATIVRNIIPPLRRITKKPMFDGEQELRIGRIISVFLALIIMGVTLALAKYGRTGIFEAMLWFARTVNFPMTVPFFLVLIFRKAPRMSAIYCIVSGMGLPILLKPVFIALGLDLDFAQNLLVTFLCSLFGFVLCYLVHPREGEEAKALTRKFYDDMHRPVDFEKEVGEANDQQQLLMLGRMSLFVSFLLLILLFVPNTFKDRLTVIIMSGAVAAIGGLLLGVARRNTRRAKAAAAAGTS